MFLLQGLEHRSLRLSPFERLDEIKAYWMLENSATSH